MHVRDEPTGKIYEVGSHRMNSDVKWDDEDVWSHDRVKLETEHTTPADNTSEKTEVHSGLLSRSRTRLLAMIGALVCYARRSITKLFAMIGATICYGILLATLFLCTTFPSIYQLEKYEYAEMVVGSSCGGDFGYHCRVHSFVDKAHRHCFPQIYSFEEKVLHVVDDTYNCKQPVCIVPHKTLKQGVEKVNCTYFLPVKI